MMIDKVSGFLKSSLGIAGIVVLVLLLICFVPMVALWTLNTLAELGGSTFYVEHTPFSYFVAFIAVALVRGIGSSKT